MAASDLQSALSQKFRADQVRVGDAAGKYAVAYWDSAFKIGDARGSWARVRPRLMTVADRFYTADTAAGQRYYNASRIVSGLKPWNGHVGPVKLRSDHAGQVLDSTGLGWFLHMVKGGSQMMDAYDSARGVLAAAMADLVMQGARDWIAAASKADPASDGWARITAGTCDFCENLAAQGVNVGEFEAHNNCECTPEPSFTASDSSGSSADGSDSSDSESSGISVADLFELAQSLGSSAATDTADSAVSDVIDEATDATTNVADTKALKLLQKWVSTGQVPIGGNKS